MNENVYSIDKFAFIGAQSVGKTTMTNIFRLRYAENPQVTVLAEAALRYFQTHPDTTDRSAKTQEQIQDLALSQEKAAHATPGTRLIITDRSVIDSIVLTQIYDPTNAQRLLERVELWLPTYTSFILLDPTGVPSDQGQYRRESSAERLAIHEGFKELCAENDLPLVEVGGILQERVDKVERIIYEGVSDKTILESDPEEFGEDLFLI